MNIKDRIQAEALEAWLVTKRGTVVLPTGVGKTRLGRLAADALMEEGLSKIAVVTSKLAILDGWKDELGGRDAELLIINSASKSNIEVDLLIVDEVHKALSPKFSQVFSSIKYKHLLCLTASLPKEQEKLDILFKYAPLVMEKKVSDVEEAMSPFRVINKQVEMSKTTKARYNYFNTAFNEASVNIAKLKRAEYGSKAIFDVARERSKMNDDSPLTAWCKKYWAYMSLRKQILYNNPSKIDAVKMLCEKHKGQNIIIFTKTIALAELIGSTIGAYVYHSKLSTSEREFILSNFGKVLVTVDAMNEGVNLVDMEVGISASGVSTQIEQIQRLGRINRIKDNKFATFYNLYVKDSPEQRWVTEKTKDLKVEWEN